jgi:hypothetical protein
LVYAGVDIMGVLRSKSVCIRKPRKCFGCFDQIDKGCMAHVQTITGSGQIYDVTLCDWCYDYVQNNLRHDDDFYEGELKEFKGGE